MLSEPGSGAVEDTRPRCAVLGRPIAHSLSPVLHRAAYATLGLDWSYTAHDVGADGLAGFVESCPANWRGLSLTMPLKEQALTLGRVDPLAAQVGAANTLIFGPEVLLYNTDVTGLAAAVRGTDRQVTSATIVGSGATARSALASLSILGCASVTVLARDAAKAHALAPLAAELGVAFQAGAFDADAVPEADLVVSTVVAGAADPLAQNLARHSRVIFDVVYHPWPTRLAQASEAAGRIVLNGLDLLAHQAVGQLQLMTGRHVDAEVLMSAGRAELARRAGLVTD